MSTYSSSLGLPSVTMTLNCFVSAARSKSAATTLEVPWTSTVLPSYEFIKSYKYYLLNCCFNQHQKQMMSIKY